jgi:hypothetical protein
MVDRKRVSVPLRVARVDERGPVRVRRCIYAFCEFSDERFVWVRGPSRDRIATRWQG